MSNNTNHAENIDLTDFVYKLHIYGGDYKKQLTNTMYNFADKSCDDFILKMDGKKIRIAPTDNDSNSVFGTLPPDTTAYMLYIDNRDSGRAYGTIATADSATLRVDINTTLDALNAKYMGEANYPRSDMIRVSYDTAHTMMINADAPIFSLAGREPRQISTMPVSKDHEFAVKKDDRAGIEKMCGRELDRLVADRFYRLPKEKAASKPSLLGQLESTKAAIAERAAAKAPDRKKAPARADSR